MTIESLVTALEAAGFDVYLNEADAGTACPYVVLSDIRHPNFGADNRTFQKVTSLELRLVEAETHDWALIDDLEEALDEIPMFYTSEDMSVPSEHVCEIIYNINFYGGNTHGSSKE